MKNLQLTIVVASLAGATSANAGVFINGGFETGNLTGWTSDTTYGYNPFGTTYGVGMEGTHWAWLAGFETSIYMEQTISGLTVGKTYNVDFIMASESINSDKLIVTANGLNAQTFSAPPIISTFWDNWVSRQYSFVATASSETIRFSTHELINASGYDVGFDNVSITEAVVPEPTTYIAGALLLLPLGVQGIRHLRSRRQVG